MSDTPKIRKLQVRDLTMVAQMINKVTKQTDLASLVKDKTKDRKEIGMAMMTAAMEHCMDDFMNWCASMCEETREEFDQRPPDAVLDVIEAVREQEEVAAFLERASKMAGTFRGVNGKSGTQ